MRWKPKNKRLLVAPTMQSNKTDAGLFIPDSAKEVPMTGEVIAVGPECQEYAVGQTVMFGKYAGSIINVDGQDCLILLEEDVYCLLDEAA
jgi:chaperonin GroES